MGSVCRGERREGASGVSLLLRTGQPWSGSITITWEFITGAEYQLHLASVIQHLRLTRDPRSLCTAHIRETVASATSQVCGSALGDLSQDKVPFKGRSGFPRGPPVVGTISGSCPGLTSRLPASCLQGGNWGRSQALLKPRHSPSAWLGHSGVQSRVITNVPESSHTPGNRP